MSKFNHMYIIAFSLTSSEEDASDVTPAMVREAVLKRIIRLPDNEVLEAVGRPEDTYEEDL